MVWIINFCKFCDCGGGGVRDSGIDFVRDVLRLLQSNKNIQNVRERRWDTSIYFYLNDIIKWERERERERFCFEKHQFLDFLFFVMILCKVYARSFFPFIKVRRYKRERERRKKNCRKYRKSINFEIDMVQNYKEIQYKYKEKDCWS